MSKNRKLFWSFSFQERKGIFFTAVFLMLEMSKGGMTRFLLMVELEKTKIKCHGI